MLGSVLGGLSGESRLYKKLMYEKPLAANASAFHSAEMLAGTFGVTITAQRGQSLDDLVAMADAEVERLKAEGPTEAEVKKAQIAQGRGLNFGLQAMGRKADFLNQNNVVHGDPLAYKAELKKIYAVTPADVKRVAAKYLTANRVRLDVNPGAPTPRPAEPPVDRAAQAPMASAAAVAVKDDFDRSVMPRPGPTPDFAPPKVVRRKLSNGLDVLIAERHNLPILTLDLVVKGGETLTPTGKEGLASLTAGLLTEGTATRDALALSVGLERDRRVAQRRGRPRGDERWRCRPSRATPRRPWSCSPTSSSTRASRRRTWSGSASSGSGPCSARPTARRWSPGSSSPASSTATRTPTAARRWGRRSRSRG